MHPNRADFRGKPPILVAELPRAPISRAKCRILGRSRVCVVDFRLSDPLSADLSPDLAPKSALRFRKSAKCWTNGLISHAPARPADVTTAYGILPPSCDFTPRWSATHRAPGNVHRSWSGVLRRMGLYSRVRMYPLKEPPYGGHITLLIRLSVTSGKPPDGGGLGAARSSFLSHRSFLCLSKSDVFTSERSLV